MKANALILGAGYFQRVHIRTLKKNHKINKIFFYLMREKNYRSS